MSAQDLLEILRAKPFVPFQIVATDGRVHAVRHPDQAMVLRSAVVLPRLTSSDVPEGLEYLSLIHIVRVEQLAPPHAPSNGTGTTGQVS